MTDDKLIAHAKAHGWEPMPTLVLLDHLPQFVRGNLRMWRHPSGVTVAEVKDGEKFINHQRYDTIEQAVNEQGGKLPVASADDEIIETQQDLGLLEGL